MSERYYDFDAIRKLPYQQKRQIVKKLAKLANSRLRALEKAGFTKNAYRYAKKYAKKDEKPRFKESLNQTPQQVEHELAVLQNFLQSRTSTVRESRRVEREYRDNLRNRFERLRELDDSEFDNFTQFLRSSQYKDSLKYLSSEQVIENALDFYEKNYSIKEIEQMYESFNKAEKGLTELREEYLGYANRLL